MLKWRSSYDYIHSWEKSAFLQFLTFFILRYMLVYIRESKLSEVLCIINDNEVPETLKQRLIDERKIEAYRRKERSKSRILTDYA